MPEPEGVTECPRGQSNCRRKVYGGLVFEETCHSHPEQYDVITEGGEQVGFVHYRGGELLVQSGACGGRELLWEMRDSAGEGWPGNRIDDDKREAWLTEAAGLIHEAMRKERTHA